MGVLFFSAMVCGGVRQVADDMGFNHGPVLIELLKTYMC
jgi:hypothetical protein